VPTIIELANQFRSRLAQKERDAALRMIGVYAQITTRLLQQIGALNRQIEAARAKGEILSPSWLSRQKRYDALLRQTSREMHRFSAIAKRTIINQQQQAANAGLRDSVDLMEAAASQADLNVTFNRLPIASIENVVGFLGDGSPLKTLLDELPKDGRQIVEQGLLEAVSMGIGPAATARKIREGLAGNLMRALTISRTESLRAYRTATHQTYKANADALRGWTWRSSRSRRSCCACIALDGTFHGLNEPFKAHVRCRCTMIPAVRTVQVDKGVDWFDEQPEDVQREIIGTDAGFQAFKEGKLKLPDFVGLERDAIWGDSYHQLSVKRALAGEGQFPGGGGRPGAPTPPPAPPAPKPKPAPKPASKSAPAPISAPVAKAAPTGKPVRDGIKLPSRGQLRKIGERTLAAIEEVHGDGKLPQIPLEIDKSKTRGGGYWYYATSPPRPIRITVRKDAYSELTFAHEIGLFLDQQGAGLGIDHASTFDPVFDEFHKAAEKSQAIKDLREYLSKGTAPAVRRDPTLQDVPVKKKFVQYLLKPTEIWARAYSQYIAIRSADPLLITQLDHLRAQLTNKYYPYQWEDDDFAPIAKTIDRLMLKLNWRKLSP
jgi:hypothetical protein